MKSLYLGHHPQNTQLGKALRGLSFNLACIHKLFLEDAQTMASQQLALAILDLATFTKQSYRELVSEIQMIERKPYTKDQASFCGPKWNGIHALSARTVNGSAVVKHCAVLEKLVIDAYQRLLKDNNRCAHVKSLLEHQLNGFRYGLARLQLLGDVVFS
ncbi:hypothetical protein [Deminuibacter soli]|uniref:DUF2383 domain-containing protein n=1 Tax=Deminuibacter soli TaxID=2291815 RepID=A0A3E1NJD1_9BACT|nr:hypothetical protein [Deminuibacter soli]RFM28045.1 hypothetical protein DXN05_10930 [Deminuibacter soli]